MKTEFILYVSDQKRSRIFYASILRREPVLDVPGMTEFMLTDDVKLGLMPENGIAKILGVSTPHPSKGNGIPRCELYLFTENIQDDIDRALKNGAVEIDPVCDRDWGDRVGYVCDPDGHVIAFAQRVVQN